MRELAKDEATNDKTVKRISAVALDAKNRRQRLDLFLSSIMHVDVRADRYSDSLLDLERKFFFAEYVNGNEKEVACMESLAEIF